MEVGVSFTGGGGGNEVCCRVCRAQFSTAELFTEHQCRGGPVSLSSVGPGPGGSRFWCGLCRKPFTQKISLQYHNIYVHGGERKAACPHCDFRAPDKAKLSLHLRTHSHHRPFVCQQCGAAFKFRSTHRAHVARHTNSGSFVCSQCSKAFTMESELREHHRIHLPDRPFLCNMCGMTFKQKKRLRVHHRAVHLRDKRFVCDVCGSSHINNWNLQTHMKTHTQMDTMCHNVCDQCGSTFRGRAGLAAHIRLRHSETRSQRSQGTYPVVEVARDQQSSQAQFQVKEENIEHVLVPQQESDLKMIEVYSCNSCNHLCDSLEQLATHMQIHHHLLLYPDLVP